MNKASEIISPEHAIEAVSHAGMEGWFDVELIHKPTGIIKQKLRFKNLITNAGLDSIGIYDRAGPGALYGEGSWMGVGSGTTPPAVTDTQLEAQIVRTNSNGSPPIYSTAGTGGTDVDYWWIKTTKVFLPGVGTGNLTEVGIFNQSTGGTMWCRQLFKDGSGTPVTIVKTSEDELRISYELRLYTMKSTNTSTFTIKSVSRTCTTRAYDVDTANRWGNTGLLSYLGRWDTFSATPFQNTLYSSSAMPAVLDNQVGTPTHASDASWGSYSSNTYYRDFTMVFSPGVGNVAIGSAVWGGGNGYIAPFITTINPPFLKTDTEKFTFTARLSWGRV